MSRQIIWSLLIIIIVWVRVKPAGPHRGDILRPFLLNFNLAFFFIFSLMPNWFSKSSCTIFFRVNSRKVRTFVAPTSKSHIWTYSVVFWGIFVTSFQWDDIVDEWRKKTKQIINYKLTHFFPKPMQKWILRL